MFKKPTIFSCYDWISNWKYMTNKLRKINNLLKSKTYALPLDIFRILAGFLALSYFISLINQFNLYISHDGLLNHELMRQIQPYTKISLLHPFMPDIFFYTVLIIGLIFSAFIIIGLKTRLSAFICFLITASMFRWNFLIIYVDDAIMNLLFLWLMLLPLGYTLSYQSFKTHKEKSFSHFLTLQVPGTALWCFLGNISIIYLISGFWKLTSPLWREGFALYAILHLPISYFPDLFNPGSLKYLSLFNWASLFVEISIPFLILQNKLPKLKAVGALFIFSFHVGIISFMRIPFANIAMLSVLVLYYRNEIMSYLSNKFKQKKILLGRTKRFSKSSKVSIALVILVTLATLRHTPIIGALNEPAYGILWVGGIGQDYRLFNWIDRTNYRVEWDIVGFNKEGVNINITQNDLFMQDLRSSLLQAYAHDISWMKVPKIHREKLRESIIQRAADRLCVTQKELSEVYLQSKIIRIVPENIDLKDGKKGISGHFNCIDNKAEFNELTTPNRQGFWITF